MASDYAGDWFDSRYVPWLTAVIDTIRPTFLRRGALKFCYFAQSKGACRYCGATPTFCCFSGALGDGSSTIEEYLHVCIRCSWNEFRSTWYTDNGDWADCICLLCGHDYNKLEPLNHARLPLDNLPLKPASVPIRIIGERLRGEPDVDYSIVVSLDGALPRLERLGISTEPHRVYFDFSRHNEGRLPAVSLQDGLYMLWVAGRHEWVGLYCKEIGSHFEGDNWGREMVLSVSGPFGLSEVHGSMILKACNEFSLSARDALTTSPPELCPNAWVESASLDLPPLQDSADT